MNPQLLDLVSYIAEGLPHPALHSDICQLTEVLQGTADSISEPDSSFCISVVYDLWRRVGRVVFVRGSRGDVRGEEYFIE